MATRKKEIQKLSIGIGIFTVVLVYVWFVFIENSYTNGISSALMFGFFAAMGSYITIQNSVSKDYPISKLKKKIIISVLIFFGAWFASTVIMAEFFGFNSGFGGLLGFILAVWAVQHYIYGNKVNILQTLIRGLGTGIEYVEKNAAEVVKGLLAISAAIGIFWCATYFVVAIYYGTQWERHTADATNTFVAWVVGLFVVWLVFSSIMEKQKKKDATLRREKKELEQRKKVQEAAIAEAEAEKIKWAEQRKKSEEKKKKDAAEKGAKLASRIKLFNIMTTFFNQNAEREKAENEAKQEAFMKELIKTSEQKLAELEVVLANPLQTLQFTMKTSFNAPEKGGFPIAIWSRGVNTLSELEKLAILIINFMEKENLIDKIYYEYYYGSIVYNNGKCRMKLIDCEGKNHMQIAPWQQMYDLHMDSHPAGKSEDIVTEVLNVFNVKLTENPLLRKPYLDKYFKRGATWFSAREFISSSLLSSKQTPYGLFLGTLKNRHQKTYFNSDESLITIAPPGSGKTQCHVLPNLMTYEAPTIILDVKGDCYKATAKHRQKYGKVLRFSPLDVKNSSHYNPLDFMSDKPIELWQAAMKISKLIIVPNQKNDHWDKRAMDILTAIIAYVKMEDESQTMTRVCDWASATTDEYDTLVATLTMSEVNGMRRAGNSLQSMLKNNPKQFEGVLDTLRVYLGAWEGDNVSAITNKSDWHIDDFMHGQNSPSLYLVIPPAEIETYAPVLRVIIGQHLSHFLSDHENIAERPILFMLDEMPRLGKFDLIPQVQDTGRSYNIKLWMFAQYVGQLRNAYGRDIADGMIGAAGVRIYMNPSEDTAVELSRQLGECDDILSNKKEPLATAVELKGREFRDDIIVLSKGENPLRLNKVFFGNMEFSLPSHTVINSSEDICISDTVQAPSEDA